MRKIQGFKLGRKLVTVFKWALKRKRKRGNYKVLEHPPSQSSKSKTISKIFDWGRNLKRGAKGLCCGKPGSRYARLGPEQSEAKSDPAVPKGHLAVYVGEKDGYPHRVLVPVIYFNHPLFAELLREAEEEYGYQHPGGITIPCRISDFESVQTRIAAGESFRKQALKYRI
ncbi:auxin-responsive protein SAUR36-like [Telopea speciosissima]|uniref:auxin-responsive protein SAUR36-like n=1 Tax=Telopea speciosissima TaxID=54955 RepID=UPI001CC3C0DC|nr:auxin-responsive protein SAUR36-like [Telopea speciosissima]XP_043715173.1 auxin-responsive protein SAUR36-like [Telopea speciosissima]